MMNEPVSAIMTTNVVTVHPEDKLSTVLDILLTKRIHHIPVVKGPNKRLVGVISSNDIFKLDRKFHEFDIIPVQDIMTTKTATFSPNEKIGAATQVFLRNLFHALPIVNDNLELLGIVTTKDILRYSFDKEYPNDEFESEWRNLEATDL